MVCGIESLGLLLKNSFFIILSHFFEMQSRSFNADVSLVRSRYNADRSELLSKTFLGLPILLQISFEMSEINSGYSTTCCFLSP